MIWGYHYFFGNIHFGTIVFFGIEKWTLWNETEILLISFSISISFQLICAISVLEIFTEDMLTFVASDRYRAVQGSSCLLWVLPGPGGLWQLANCKRCKKWILPPSAAPDSLDPPFVACFPKSGKPSKQLEKHWRDDVCWCLLMSSQFWNFC